MSEENIKADEEVEVNDDTTPQRHIKKIDDPNVPATVVKGPHKIVRFLNFHPEKHANDPRLRFFCSFMSDRCW